MYRCELCRDVSEPGEPMLRHIIYRRVPALEHEVYDPVLRRTVIAAQNRHTQIEKEIPVCRVCHTLIKKMDHRRLRDRMFVRPTAVLTRELVAAQLVPLNGKKN